MVLRQMELDDRYRAYALAGARAELDQLTQKIEEIYALFPELLTGVESRRTRTPAPPAPAPPPPLRSKQAVVGYGEGLLTVSEAAEIAKVSNASIYRWRSVGYITGHDTPEGLRFARKDVHAAIKTAEDARRANGARIGERNRGAGSKRESRTAPEEPAAAPPEPPPAAVPLSVVTGNTRICERCGAQFERKLGSAGRFCKRSCYEDRGNQLPFVAEAPPAETPPPETTPGPVEMPEPVPGRPDPDPEPLTLKEAADYAKVPYTQIYAWQRRGILTSLGSNGHGALYDPRAIDLAKARAAASSTRLNSPFVSNAI